MKTLQYYCGVWIDQTKLSSIPVFTMSVFENIHNVMTVCVRARYKATNELKICSALLESPTCLSQFMFNHKRARLCTTEGY